jgi:hypothetical protein
MPEPRRYRWVLLAYPRAYRRERGREIIDTFLDAGREKLSAREIANLLRHGMRARLGRPASRRIVALAALTSILCGLFAGSFATRAAWETARPLPSTDEAKEIFGHALPGHPVTDKVYRSPAMFVIYEAPLGADNWTTLLTLDGGEYQLGRTRTAVDGVPGQEPRDIAAAAQARLREAGWKVNDIKVGEAVGCGGPSCDPATLPMKYTVTGRRGDTLIRIETIERSTPGTTYLVAELGRATPWAAWPLGLAGFLFGALGGWLLFGWACRRLESGHPVPQALATVSYSFMLFLWCFPIGLALFSVTVYTLTVERAIPEGPVWHWIGLPTFTILFLLGCVNGLAILALAALPRRRRAPGPQISGAALSKED